jgi:nitrogen-specific signal transduction histidine kinase
MMNDEIIEIPQWMAQCQNLYQLIQSVGHELYNPLFPIKGYAALLLAGEEGKAELSSENRKELLQAIINQGNYIDEIIKSMRAAARQLEQNNSEE